MTKKKTAKAVEAVRAAVPAGTETKTRTAEVKPAKEKADKAAKIQGQVDANAAAILKAHDEGKSVKEFYKMFGIDKGLFDAVQEVLDARRVMVKQGKHFKYKGLLTCDQAYLGSNPAWLQF
ncbi:MAG: hypothetical protein ABSG73_11565 [Candidatus Aminicenantales bacterium]|jgi:cob(I)alamin adenosyltransferase